MLILAARWQRHPPDVQLPRGEWDGYLDWLEHMSMTCSGLPPRQVAFRYAPVSSYDDAAL